MKAFGSTILILFIFVVGMGMALGLLVSNSELLRPQEARLNYSIATQRWQLEQQQAYDQLLYDRQSRAQALENQRARGAATAQVIERTGPFLMVALGVAIVLIAAGYAYRLVVDSMLALRDYQAPRPASPARALPSTLVREPIPFPDPQHARRMRKDA